MDHVGWMSDVYGPRVTGTPNFHAGERVGDEAVHRVGPRQRAPGALRVRSGLARRALLGAHHRAGAAADHRLSAHLLAVDRRARSAATSCASTSAAKRTSRSTRASCAARSCCRRRCARVRMLEDRVVLRMNEEDIAEGADDADSAAAGAGGRGRRAAAAPAFADEDRAVLRRRRRGGAARARIGQRPVGRRERPVVADAARRRRHDLPEQRRQPRSEGAAAGAVGDDRRRALQPHGARARQGPAGAVELNIQTTFYPGSGGDAQRHQHHRRDSRAPISPTKS